MNFKHYNLMIMKFQIFITTNKYLKRKSAKILIFFKNKITNNTKKIHFKIQKSKIKANKIYNLSKMEKKI
jgi:hypothetical protein